MAEEKNIPAAMTPEETAPQQAEIPAETPQEAPAAATVAVSSPKLVAMENISRM